MGGGDLNLKKSWHPSIRSNRKRVWEEQKKNYDEQKRIDQVRKERAEERQLEELQRLQEEAGGPKRLKRVEFLYSGPGGGQAGSAGASDDREAFLLGKRRLDTLLQNDNAEVDALKKDTRFEARVEPVEDVPRGEESKARNDPLFAMKKRQQDAIDAILADPVRRREVARTLGIETPELKGRSSRKDSGISRHRDSRSEGSRKEERGRDTDRRGPRRHRDRSDSSGSRDGESRRSHRSDRHRDRDPERRSRHRDSDRDRHRERRKHSPSPSPDRERGRARRSRRERSRSASSSRSVSPARSRDGRSRQDQSHNSRRSGRHDRRRSRSRSRSPARSRSRSPPSRHARRDRDHDARPHRDGHRQHRQSKHPPADSDRDEAAQREAALSEMQASAASITKDRQGRIEAREEQERAEERELEKNRKDGEDAVMFIGKVRGQASDMGWEASRGGRRR